MATVILTAAGAAVAGPVGGLIGAIIGSQIDAQIFKSPAREGPRIKELDIQTSSYGSSVPAIFGAMRVAGSVIWATDLMETRNKKSGGKGKPAAVNFTYSVHMAVALSSRPLARIGRIWADGNLLRGAAGDFKVPVSFRFYSGHDDQAADPLIASAEGAGNAPAFRGISYAMFEDFQLADFGNRIPSLTFEVFEREGDVAISDIVGAATHGMIISDSQETVQGYALEGTDAKSGLSPLLSAMPVFVRPQGNRLALNDFWQNSANLVHIKTAAQLDTARFDPPQQSRQHSGLAPQSLTIRHYDPAREYQIGVQRSRRVDTGRRAGQMELPATLSASRARRLADLQLLQIQRFQQGWNGHAIVGADILRAGDLITNGRSSDIWQITEIEHLGLVSRISARQALGTNSGDFAVAEPGRSLPGEDAIIGATQIVLMDLPVLASTDPQKMQVVVAAAGNTASWRSASLSQNVSGNITSIGFTAPAAIMGAAENSLAPHSPYLYDNHNFIIVKLLHDEMQLPPGSGTPQAANAPYIWLSGEVMRYGLAEYLGGARYRISRLLRGCHGTEVKIASHQIADKFVLLETDTLRLLDDIPISNGMNLNIEAIGIGDENPALAALNITGLAIKPLSPVHGNAQLTALGDIALSWIRRSRVDYGWQDGVEQPQAEDAENYAVRVLSNGQPFAELDATANHLIIPAAVFSSWNLTTPNMVTFEVRHIGKFAQSEPLAIQLLL
jgi:Putative phage tail protein